MHNNTEERRFFDFKWYLQQNPGVLETGMDPLTHFCSIGWKQRRNPSKHFDVQEYLEQYPELEILDINPFLHMEFLCGNKVKNECTFPNTFIETEAIFTPLEADKAYNRIVIFASFTKNGVIPIHVYLYLRELKKHADAIIFIADNPILPEEVKKLSHLVSYAAFARHGAYDFGSYKKGLEYIRAHIDLHNIEELLLCNDSVVGPLFPFADMFTRMGTTSCDFWGLVDTCELKAHVQSFFLCFRKHVFTSPVFLDFFATVTQQEYRSHIILKYEILLSHRLFTHGFVAKAYIPQPTEEEIQTFHMQFVNITRAPLYMLHKKSPLIKIQTLYDTHFYSQATQLVSYLKKHHPNIFHAIDKEIQAKKRDFAKAEKEKKTQLPTKAVLAYNLLSREVQLFMQEWNALTQNSHADTVPFPKKAVITVPESRIVHRYLDGLNGIEIGASTMNPFGLEKTGAYLNIDFAADHGERWQPGTDLAPAKVDIVALGDKLPFKDATYDYVVNAHVIEHFFDPIQAIQEWLRVVKKHGHVVMIVPHKNRTFDRLRPITQLQELYDRHNGLLAMDDYAYKFTENPTTLRPLERDWLIICKNIPTPEGYTRLTRNISESQAHFSVWTTESFVNFCKAMGWNIVKVCDMDDKMGNGFLVILKKR